jgi:hypothetical protein
MHFSVVMFFFFCVHCVFFLVLGILITLAGPIPRFARAPTAWIDSFPGASGSPLPPSAARRVCPLGTAISSGRVATTCRAAAKSCGRRVRAIWPTSAGGRCTRRGREATPPSPPACCPTTPTSAPPPENSFAILLLLLLLPPPRDEEPIRATETLEEEDKREMILFISPFILEERATRPTTPFQFLLKCPTAAPFLAQTDARALPPLPCPDWSTRCACPDESRWAASRACPPKHTENLQTPSRHNHFSSESHVPHTELHAEPFFFTSTKKKKKKKPF